MTQEECLSVERTNSIRRAGKAITAVENSPAYLHCQTMMETTDNLVAWTRLTDDALLTAGGRSFTSDSRFQISPKRETSSSRDWVLIIRRVQVNDAGCYLCEINTEPLSTLIPVFLRVVTAAPSEGSRRHSQQLNSQRKRNSNLVSRIVDGNALLLNCTIEPKYLTDGEDRRFRMVDVMWTRDNQPIDLFNEKKYFTDFKIANSGALVYTLRIADVSPKDDGLYACEGDDLTRSAQMVHVNSEYPGSLNSASYIGRFSPLTLILLSLFLHY